MNTLERICASSWILTKNHCMMHGQQNVEMSDEYGGSISGMIWAGKPEYTERNLSHCPFAMDRTGTGPGSNTDYCPERPMANQLNCGMAQILTNIVRDS